MYGPVFIEVTKLSVSESSQFFQGILKATLQPKYFTVHEKKKGTSSKALAF